MNTLTFHEDPGHGWLEVPMAELRRLKIADQISQYSYQSRDGRTAYLEEDCDLSVYLRAAGLYFPIQGMRTLYHEDDRIRNLPSYSPPAPRITRRELADALNPRVQP